MSSWTDAWDLFKRKVWYANQIWLNGFSVANSIQAMEKDILSQWTTAMTEYQVNQMLATINGELDNARRLGENQLAGLKVGLEACLMTMVYPISSNQKTITAQFWIDLKQYMDTNAQTILRRNVSRGAIAVGGNNHGDGTIKRFTTDKFGNLDEVGIAGITKAECVSDPTTNGNENQSNFRVFYSGDRLRKGSRNGHLNDPNATTETAALSTVTAEDNSIINQNKSFEDYLVGGTVRTMFPGWILSDATKFGQWGGAAETAANNVYKKRKNTIDSTYTYGRGSSLRILATGVAIQTARFEILSSNLKSNKPYIFRSMVKRDTTLGGDGTITMKIMDNHTAGNTLLAGTPVAIGAAWAECLVEGYLRNFNTSPMYLVIERSVGALNEAAVANVYFGEYDKYFNGCYLKSFQGQTDFQVANPTDQLADYATFTDTFGTGILQYWIQRFWNISLASIAGPTIVDPVTL